MLLGMISQSFEIGRLRMGTQMTLALTASIMVDHIVQIIAVGLQKKSRLKIREIVSTMSLTANA